MVTIERCGQSLVLLEDRAVHWPAARSLFIADVHLGKASAFGSAGIPVPDTTPRTLGRLSSLIQRTRASRLIVLGDLIHAKSGRTDTTMQAIAAWRRSLRSIEIVLVRGNHDHGAGDPPGEWGVQCVEAPWHEPPFVCCHTPEECMGTKAQPESGVYGLCGHLHPVFALNDGGVSSVRAPCLWMTPTYAVLPAFGDFTGGKRVRARPGDRVFLFGDRQVVEIPCV